VGRLLVVTGKGGVGKTVVSAALASLLARRRRPVLLLEADPRESLHRLFGAPPSGGEVVDAAPRIQLLNASPRAILDGAVRETLKVGALSRRVIASPIYEHFADGAPGLKEMMLLGHAMRVLDGETPPPADDVVLDAPASGHALALLAAPLLVADAIGTGPIGRMAQRIAHFIADPKRSAVIITALAEEMAITETLETARGLAERVGRPPALVVVNAVTPPVPAGAPRTGPLADTIALWRARRGAAEEALETLAAGWDGATATLPLLAQEFGQGLVEEVVEALEPQLPGKLL